MALAAVLTLVLSSGAEAAVARSCAAGSVVMHQNLYGKGIKPMRLLEHSTIAKCCAACLDDPSCGAYFGKVGKDPESTGSCNLYDLASAANLSRGDCPGSRPHICGSAVWVGPVPIPPTPPAPPTPRPDIVHLDVSGDRAWTISPYLASMSLVYAWAPDAAYANGTMAHWAATHRLNTARYPAGMAAYWNWENPSGVMGVSSLNPAAPPPAPAADWMSLAEYLQLCKAARMRPLIGVNYNCHNYQKCNETKADSIARAVRQVKFVVDQGFSGAFWYIGNEDGAPQHAALIASHARAMKAVDPTLKAFWNDNNLSPEHLRAFLSVAGDVMDGAEFTGSGHLGAHQGLPHFPTSSGLRKSR